MRSSWILRAIARARSASSSRPAPTSDSSPWPISPTTAPSTVTAAVPTLLTTARTSASSRAGLPEVGEGADLDAVPRRGALHRWIAEGRVRRRRRHPAVGVPELDQQHLVPAHPGEPPPLVRGIVADLPAAADRLE